MIKIPKQAKQVGATAAVALFGLFALNTAARRFRPAAALRSFVNNGI